MIIFFKTKIYIREGKRNLTKEKKKVFPQKSGLARLAPEGLRESMVSEVRDSLAEVFGSLEAWICAEGLATMGGSELRVPVPAMRDR